MPLQQDQEGAGMPSQLAAREYFGARAERYRQSAGHGNAEVLAQIVQFANLQGDEFVLDIGTGPGHLACAFAPHVRHVVASDLTLGMLHEVPVLMEQKGVTNLWRVAVDTMAIPFQNETFDLVTSRSAAHHFPDHAPAVQEMARVSKQGGRVLTIDSMGSEDPEAQAYIDDIERLRDSSHISSHSHAQWQQAYENAGLEVVQTQITQSGMKDIEGWMARSDTSPENRERIFSMLQSPPASVKRHVDMGQDAEGNWFFNTSRIQILGHKL